MNNLLKPAIHLVHIHAACCPWVTESSKYCRGEEAAIRFPPCWHGSPHRHGSSVDAFLGRINPASFRGNANFLRLLGEYHLPSSIDSTQFPPPSIIDRGCLGCSIVLHVVVGCTNESLCQLRSRLLSRHPIELFPLDAQLAWQDRARLAESASVLSRWTHEYLTAPGYFVKVLTEAIDESCNVLSFSDCGGLMSGIPVRNANRQ